MQDAAGALIELHSFTNTAQVPAAQPNSKQARKAQLKQLAAAGTAARREAAGAAALGAMAVGQAAPPADTPASNSAHGAGPAQAPVPDGPHQAQAAAPEVRVPDNTAGHGECSRLAWIAWISDVDALSCAVMPFMLPGLTQIPNLPYGPRRL